MPRRRHTGVRAGACLFGTLLVLGAIAVSTPAATAPMPVPRALTGTYQLYCPDPVETPIVLHVRAKATISPDDPALGSHFLVSGFQTRVTFPQGVASALAQMSPITGNVKGTVLLVGATPYRRAVRESFVATIPASVPTAGLLLGTGPPRQPRHLHREL